MMSILVKRKLLRWEQGLELEQGLLYSGILQKKVIPFWRKTAEN